MGIIRSELSFMTFRVGESWFAAPLSVVEGVAPIPEITQIPGRSSPALVGLAYILGQIMAVADLGRVAPGAAHAAFSSGQDAVILQYNRDYYAVQISKAGRIVAQPRLTKMRSNDGLLTSEFFDEGKRVQVLDVDSIVQKYLCG